MAWIKIRSSLDGKTSIVTKTAFDNFFKKTNIFTIVDEPSNKKVKEKDNGDIHINEPTEVNSTRQNKKKD